MNITNVRYIYDDDDNLRAMKATIDGVKLGVPASTGNRHYKAIQEWIAAGNTPEGIK